MSQTRARLNNRYRLMSFSIVLSALATAVVSIGVALWWRQDELPLILSMVIGYIIPVIILGIPRIDLLIQSSRLKHNERVSVVKIGFAGVITAPMYWIVSSLDRWLLGYFADAASVGIYSIGYNVAIMGMMVNNALMSVWLPEASRLFENDPEEARIQLGKLAETIVIGLALVWLTITASGGDLVRLLVGPKFHSSIVVIPYIAGAIFFNGILHLSNACLLLNKKLHYAIWWWLISAIICVIMNILLIPILGIEGAAITQTSSFGLLAIGIVSTAQKNYPLKIQWFRLLFSILGILIMGLALFPPWVINPLASLLIKFPVGMLIALLALKIMVPNYFSVIRRCIGYKDTVRG